MTVDHHGDRIADEDGVYIGLGDETCGPGIVGGDHRYLAPLGLETGEIADGGHRRTRKNGRKGKREGVALESGTCRMDQVLHG